MLLKILSCLFIMFRGTSCRSEENEGYMWLYMRNTMYEKCSQIVQNRKGQTCYAVVECRTVCDFSFL